MSASRRWMGGVNAALATFFVLATLGVVGELAHRHRFRLDLSADGLATLDPDTRAAVDLLTSAGTTATVTAFSSQARNEEAWVRDRMIRDFLGTLSAASDRITTSFVDFDRDRLTAEQLGVDRYGTVVVASGNDRVDVTDRDLFRAKGPAGRRDVTFIGEAAIAAAIRRVVSGNRDTVVLLTGHGEDAIYDRGLGELRELANRIDAQGLTARTVDLLRDAPPGSPPAVPDDAAAVIVLGASAPLASAEVDALRSYLRGGGSLGVFLDPDDPAPDWLAEAGIAFPAGVALDRKTYFPHRDRPVLRYGYHPITEALAKDDVPTVVALARPVAVTPLDGVSAVPLLETGREGWIERGDEPEPSYTPEIDGGGPVTVAAAVTVASPHPWAERDAARLVVIGDVDVVRDELLADAPGNATFVTNVLRWLVRSDQAYARVGRPTQLRRIELGAGQLTALRVVLMGCMPLLAAVGAAIVLGLRRSR